MKPRNLVLFIVFELLAIALANIPAIILVVSLTATSPAGIEGILFLSLVFAIVGFFISLIPVTLGAFLLYFFARQDFRYFFAKSLAVAILVGSAAFAGAYFSGLAKGLLKFDLGSLAYAGTELVLALIAWQLLARNYLEAK